MKLLFSIALILALAFTSCAKKSTDPVVANIDQVELSHKLSAPQDPSQWAQHMTPSTKEVKTLITFNKNQIFDRDFLYGADLQHSTIYDADSKLYDQVYSMGHEIAFFRKVGAYLQLIANQEWKFESDVNKPERLINEFYIMAESDKTITVEIKQPSPVLRQMFWGSQTDQTRTSWLRSVQFDPNGNYLLMESSIETLKGEIVEHMESLFPRENLVSSETKPLWLTETEELANRFEFLAWFPVFRQTDAGRVAAPAAFKFDLTKTKSVKWYVTANVPDDIMRDVQTSVEGWNRYFQKMWGTDGLVFAGKLPAHAKLGDPRYNVIVWDNVQDGDAAYESQAVDPLTGIQSHSNIYIPFSWLKTATEYWTDAQFANHEEETAAKIAKQEKWLGSKSFMGSPLRFGCFRDLSKIVLYGQQKSEEELHILARDVLKAVIMHEVGHGLGMDHNFKGSLINENGQFTSSIMDYNHYNLEKPIFDNVDSAKGPILEYDRQFLDALYNNGETLKDSPVLPSCNDGDADNTVGGVDPMCSRYDAGTNPYSWMLETIQLIEKPTYKLGLLKSLTEALTDVQTSLGATQDIVTKEDFEIVRDDFFAREAALFDFYAFAGAHSLRYITTANLKSLKNIAPGILENTAFNEASLRQQTLSSLEYIFTSQMIPQAPLQQLATNIISFNTWAQATAYFASLSPVDQLAALADVQAKHTEVISHIQTVTFAKVRQRIAANLAHDETNAYYFSSESNLDVESYVVDLLKKIAITKSQGEFARSNDERKAAITSFMTFRAANIADAASAEEITTVLKAELKLAKNSQERTTLRALLAMVY
ncbi:MAG: zinc-dependent metalloprotease [Bdellovibrionota bacterium]